MSSDLDPYVLPEAEAPAAGLAADAAMEALRLPPHSIQAEQAVLGGLMLDDEAWDKVADQLGADDFYRREHQLIFRAMTALSEAEQPLDVVTLAEELERRGELDDVGGLPYLGSLANDTPSAANVAAYARLVREQSVMRQLIKVGNRIAESCYRPEGRKVDQLLDEAENQVFQIAEQQAKGRSGFRSIKALLTETVNRIEELFASGSALTGVSTGFDDFDAKTSGLQKSDLIIVAGRPSMGKTTFAMNIAENVAIGSGMPVAIFSMEMPGEALTMRMISSLGRINQQAVRTGKLEDEDWPRVMSAVSLLNEAKLFIDDTPALTPGELRARCRRLMKEHGQLGLVVVDYLQLMQAPDAGENRTNEISAISRGLKTLAKELNVPVIALSQLNRSLEQRPNKRPVMSDLRESGAIEQDADLIVFIYRDEVYNEDSPDKGKAEIIIGKQRNGPIGTVNLTFQGQYTRFDNYAHDVYGDGEY
ncbi:MAG: replicative DNA helicase [Gammaproteobacteria bacterium]|nr:MAG: replicative DNA helicase [Gammaproteobacteria bacterium]